jgi:hypothetical protein
MHCPHCGHEITQQVNINGCVPSMGPQTLVSNMTALNPNPLASVCSGALWGNSVVVDPSQTITIKVDARG